MTQESNETEKVIDEIRNDRIKEIATTRAELEVAKLKAEIRKLNSEEQSVHPQQSMNLVSAIVAQNLGTPERAQAFLSSLDQDNLNKLGYLISTDNPRAEALTSLMRSPTTSVKDLVEIVKAIAGPRSEGTSMKEMAEVFKVAIDYAKANQPQTQNMAESYKSVMDIVKPFYDTLAVKDQQLVDARLKEIEAKIVNPVEWFQQQKTIAGQLGFESKGGKIGDLDLKFEEMRQRHDLDMEQIRWEKEKFLLGKEADTEKWGNLKEVFSPIFAMPEVRDVVRKIGESVGKSIEGTGNPTKQPNIPASSQPQIESQIESFICPECNTELSIPLDKLPPNIQGIKCPKCETVSPIPQEFRETSTEKESPPPPEEKPVHTTRLKPIYR